MSSDDKEPLAETIVEEVGESPEPDNDEGHESRGDESADEGEESSKKRPTGWERLKKKNRQHEREIRELHARIAEMQSNAPSLENSMINNGNGFQGNPGNVDETIQKAVGFALQQKEMEERQAREAQAQAEIGKEYQELQKHLDHTSDKYDDFDDVVRGNDAPFTPTIRDAALLLPKDGPGSAGEVLYKLGKNPEELARISQLLPHKQASEVIKLSHALIRGGENKAANNRPLGTIKSNPVVNSVGITEKTSPAQIRALMKAGKFK